MKLSKLVLGIALATSSFVAFASDNNTQAQIDQLKADIHTVHMNTLQKYSESWGLEDRGNIAKLQETKVDKSVFSADQQRQDKALSDAVTNQAAVDSKQTTDLKGYADKKATSAYQTSVAHTDAKVARADADRLKGDNALNTRIDNNQATQSARDAGQDQHINAVQDAAQIANDRASNLEVRADGVEQKNSEQDTHINAVQNSAQAANESAERLSGAIQETNAQVSVTDKRSQNNAVRLDGVETVNTTQEKRLDQHQSDISALYGESSVQSQRLDISNRNIAANKAALESTNKVVSAHSAQLSNHEQRIGQLEQATSSKFANIDKRFDETDRHIDAGLSGVAAMANIPQVTEYQTFAVGAGLGARGDQSAVAVGFSARATENVVLKVSVAGDSQQKWTVGGGMSYGW